MIFNKVFKKRMLVVTLFVFGLSLLIPAAAIAQGESVINEDINKAAGSLEIPRNTTVNGNITLNLGELTVDGIVNGNVNSNMGQVTINGDINGNVDTNMGQVVINGNVAGDVKTRMGEVLIKGSVGGNVFADLGATNIDGTVGGSIGSGFGELKIAGAVAGDVNSKAGNVIITGIVEGDVILEQGVVELGPNAVVSGKISVGRGLVKLSKTSVTGPVEIIEEVTLQEFEESDGNGSVDTGYRFDGIDQNFVESIGRRVEESVNRAFRDSNFMPHMFRNRDWVFFPFPFMGFSGSSIARGVINMLIMFALAALTSTLFPKHVRAAGNAITVKPGPVIGWGILAAVLAIPLMILLAITIIGIPLIIVEILFLAAAAILGYTGLTGLIGSRIIRNEAVDNANSLGAIALGVLIIGLIGMIPILGWLVTLTVYILAIGAALVTRFGASDPAETVQELPGA
ncbi:MAG: polymer-forming cytoskeletal protein [Bacillota bacterium]|nr:polymer-forming cytoskeletal protein [Bacillota bacterium]